MPMPKDPKKAEETRRKMSESAKRKLANPEVKRALDEKRIQGIRKPEAKAKMSESQKKRFANPEARKVASELAKEAMTRPDVQKKLSVAQLKRYQEHPEQRTQKSEHMRKLYTETDLRERVSKATKEAMVEVNARPEFQENLKKAMQEVRMRPEWKASLREGQKKRYLDPEAKRKLAEVMAEVRARPEYREAVAAGIAASKKFSRTDIEIIVESLLQTSGVEYEAQKHIGWWIVDFYIPDKNLVIECDGDYWHNKPEVKARDARKDAYLTRKGYQVLRLLGSQIMANQLESFYQALE